MTSDFVSIGPRATLDEVIYLLAEKQLGAIPVVEADNTLIGIIDIDDLLASISGAINSHLSWILNRVGIATQSDDRPPTSIGRTVRDIMISVPLAIDPDASMSEVASALAFNQVKRAPVVSGGKLVGMISRANLLHAIAAGAPSNSRVQREGDRKIEDEIPVRLENPLGGPELPITVVVPEGIFHLHGSVDTKEATEIRQLLTPSLHHARSARSNRDLTDLFASDVVTSV